MELKEFQKLRLQEFNSFDLERILKENIDTLDEENTSLLGLIETYAAEGTAEFIKGKSDEMQDNAAEAMFLTSLLHNDEDVYSHFTGGPLFRKDRDAK